MSGKSSNLTSKMDSDVHRSVAAFVQGTTSASGQPAPQAQAFSFDGERGAGSAKLCKHLPGGQTECTQIAMEAKDLFAQMQHLGFFCQLPQDPRLTHIQCRRLPSE
ncbi:hypothetical protein FA09DRAFT_360204 [Tilletiopsis washingtonensis]|uniref:Uncharacterized protein n=1 Tax=Tilletiopsis washingtonensis TaxID=58919 RepID=A0A316Z9U5_9BASI|nr:hypothetical protein FA09DRAFT_360204 [Tilletiopsis washingtonensis]PWN98470.1 hypothetical protein FA09DRAFT_360204 [Tilletiopsis washingtonensis]